MKWYLNNVNIDIKIVRSVKCEPFSFQHLISFFRLKWPKEKASELEEKFEASLRFIFLFTFYNTLTRSYLGEHEVLMQLTIRKGLSRNVTRNAQSVHSYFELIFLLFILPLSELLNDFHTYVAEKKFVSWMFYNWKCFIVMDWR